MALNLSVKALSFTFSILRWSKQIWAINSANDSFNQISSHQIGVTKFPNH